MKNLFYIEDSLINFIINKINGLADFNLSYTDQAVCLIDASKKIEDCVMFYTVYNFLHENVVDIINNLNNFAKYKNVDILYIFFDVENGMFRFT